MSKPPLLRPGDVLRLALGFLPAWFDVNRQLITGLISSVWYGITHLSIVAIFNAGLSYLTTAPFSPVIAIVRDLGLILSSRAAYYHRFVIPGDHMVKFITQTTEDVFKFSANIGNDTITDSIIQWGAATSWNIISRNTAFNKFFKIIKITSYDQLYDLYKASALRKIWTLFIQVLLVWFSLAGAMATLLYLGLKFHKTFTPLSQDSPRVILPRNKARHRERAL